MEGSLRSVATLMTPFRANVVERCPCIESKSLLPSARAHSKGNILCADPNARHWHCKSENGQSTLRTNFFPFYTPFESSVAKPVAFTALPTELKHLHVLSKDI
ncbi:hypothetical protein CEXT_728021 [Caerostris extrusa]|uniref:Uncharacterized protein n=1 Tax=Caerostris extrusa TaxID=172846 RepID=A0AAV4SW10_CAEEX|nr:hypothetical protein CEXT_728021 [Caerostris extrusa]